MMMTLLINAFPELLITSDRIFNQFIKKVFNTQKHSILVLLLILQTDDNLCIYLNVNKSVC